MAHQDRSAEKSSLNIEAQLGQGGFGKVFRVSSPELNFNTALAYKEFKSSTVSLLDFTTLTEFINFFNHFDDERKQWLINKTAWPLRTVTENGSVTGFIMPLISPEFTTTITTSNSVQRSTQATMELLCQKPLTLHNRGIVVSRRDEYFLLKDLCKALVFLHSEGIVVGDFSVKNILYSLRPEPHVFLIDCDSMIVRGQCVAQPAETPGWEVPHGEPPTTTESDAYKFSLLVLRLLAGDQQTRSANHLPADCPDDLRNLITRGLNTDPHQRPTMYDFYRAIRDHCDTADTTPLGSTTASQAIGPLFTSGLVLKGSVQECLVEKSSLNIGRQLGQDGLGNVFQVSAPALNFDTALAYKEFTPSALAQLDLPALVEFIDLYNELDEEDKQWLITHIEWPLRIVTENGSVTGFIMALISPEFTTTITTSNYAQRSTQATMELLCQNPFILHNQGINISRYDQYYSLMQLNDVLVCLRFWGIVVGDLSAKNVLYSLDPEPRIFVIGCDSMILDGKSITPPTETPGWEVPHGISFTTREADVYKFSLLALRLLAGDQHTRSVDDLPTDCPGDLRNLITRGLSADANEHPYLDEFLYTIKNHSADTTPLGSSSYSAPAVGSSSPSVNSPSHPTLGSIAAENRAREKRRALKVAAVMILLALLTVLIVSVL